MFTMLLRFNKQQQDNADMKKIAFLFLTLLLTAPAFATGKQLSAMFGYSVFYLPESNQPYVETYLNFDAWSLNFVKEGNNTGYRATVEVTILVRKDDSVAYVKKYDLNSPLTHDLESTGFTFFDLQRFGIGNGIYDLEMTLRDKASNNEPLTVRDKLIVYFANQAPAMSNIQLMASATPTENPNMLSRSGYDMVPYIDDFVPEEVTHLHPYFEIYNLNHELGNDPFIVSTYVEQKENGLRLPNIGQMTKHNPAGTNTPVYTDVDITNLPSGNYRLVVEVQNQQGEPLFKQTVQFMRSNPKLEDITIEEAEVATSFAALITDEETLNYYINALYPVSSVYELSNAKKLMANGGLTDKQAYFYRFWKSRDPLNPAGKWHEYLTNLTYVDEHFSYPLTPGYRTDMGRVYLQYGPPSFVRDEKNFVGALGLHRNTAELQNINSYGEGENLSNQGHIYYLPYQIWRYNQIPGDYENRVFLFWDEFRSGFYRLLNSNARGEVRTMGWERMLSRNTMDEGAIGEVGMQFNRGF